MSIEDPIAQALLRILPTFGIGTDDMQIFRLGTTLHPRALGHPLLFSKERIASIGEAMNIL